MMTRLDRSISPSGTESKAMHGGSNMGPGARKRQYSADFSWDYKEWAKEEHGGQGARCKHS